MGHGQVIAGDDGFDFPDLLKKAWEENGEEGKAKTKAQTYSGWASIGGLLWFGQDHCRA
jgi:hypothetical protein